MKEEYIDKDIFKNMQKIFTNVNEEELICSNCGEVVEEYGTSELAIQDKVCEECMDNGYGQ